MQKNRLSLFNYTFLIAAAINPKNIYTSAIGHEEQKTPTPTHIIDPKIQAFFHDAAVWGQLLFFFSSPKPIAGKHEAQRVSKR